MPGSVLGPGNKTDTFLTRSPHVGEEGADGVASQVCEPCGPGPPRSRPCAGFGALLLLI